MHEPPVEALFAAFRDTGDVQALAAVFDKLAPQLLLVAAHLAGGEVGRGGRSAITGSTLRCFCSSGGKP